MAAKIRILQVIKTLNISGAERFALDLACWLDPGRYDIQLCAFFQDGSEIEAHWMGELNRRGIPAWHAAPWRGLDHFGSYLQGIGAMERYLRGWRADIIHTHFQLGTLAALYCRGRGLARRVVRTAQNHSRKEWSPGAYGWLRHLLISGWLYPLACDAEVGVSRAIVAELGSHPGAHFARRPPRWITNAVPAGLVERAAAIPRPARAEGSYVVGSIGRLMPQKGYTYLIQAAPQVKAALPGVEFWIIGDGELRRELEEESRRLGAADYVQFKGRQAEVLPWLRQTDLFVLPSLWEGVPLAVMESMAAGTPVLATDIPGTRDLVTHGRSGWLVPPADPAALADAVITALRDPAARAQAAARALASLDAFTLDRVGRQYEQLYQELLAPRSPKARWDEIRLS